MEVIAYPSASAHSFTRYPFVDATSLRRVPSRAVNPLMDLFLRDADASFDEQTYALAISLCKHFNSLGKARPMAHSSGLESHEYSTSQCWKKLEGREMQ